MENNYQLSRIHNYVNGLMSRDEMHTLEREALDDPFLKDAIDGYEMQNGVDARPLSLLQQRLAARVQEQASLKNRRFYGWQRLAIGATAAVMFITVCTLLLIRYMPQNRTSALAEVEIMQDRVYSIAVANTGKYDAEPIMGWPQFELYLSRSYTGENNLEGDVKVNFKIDQNGKPTDIKVHDEKAVSAPYEEIIELLEHGPKWIGKEGEIRLNVQQVEL